MSNAPVYEIDPERFWTDPYPDLRAMQETAPIAFIPQIGATVLTRHRDVTVNEKRTEVFSSWQPEGLMTRLMGENMMRKDGEEHMVERRVVYPAMSPRTVASVWRAEFEARTREVLDRLAPRGEGDLVRDFAMPVSAEALKAITGLTNMHYAEMDRVSQGMIDGCANYANDPAVEARCHDCTASIDRHITARLPEVRERPDASVLSVQLEAGLSDAQIRANIKLNISGGQNEPRDAIAGTAWALLTHPAQYERVVTGENTWMDAFEEYARWISPIGMSPRRIARAFDYEGVHLEAEDRAFFMFGAANRDPEVFERPDVFDMSQDARSSIAFGAGPHFCAGKWASRTLIGEVALPLLFERLQGLEITGDVPFGGWAFRGPLRMPVRWSGCGA